MTNSTTGNREEISETLPFSDTKQQALLGYLLTDEKFFHMAKHRIKAEWWTNPRLSQLWNISMQYATKYNRAPMATEVGESPFMVRLDLAEQNKLRSVLNLCVERRIDFGLDALSSELTDWLHARTFIAAMKQAEALFNQATKTSDSKKFQEAYAVLKVMNREIDETSFEAGQVEAMDDPEKDFLEAATDAEHAVSFGLPAFDHLLLPDSKKYQNGGSLLKGDMTVLLAPTNIGKTTTMVTIAAHNILQGRDVLLVTHEGRKNDIKMKIWQCIIGLSRQIIIDNLADPYIQHEMKLARELVNKHLEFMPLNKAGLAVEDVEVIIRRRCDRWKAQHLGKGFDLIIDDYAAKLTTVQAKGGHFALRQIHEIVYNYFSQIALEQNLHVVTAIQTNREGSRANNRKVGKGEVARLLTMEDVMESWGPMTTAANVISINRDPVAQAKGVVTFLICKSRSSEVGWAVVVKSDYAAARSHWRDAACTWYRGGTPMSDNIDSLLQSHGGHEIPWDTVKKLDDEAHA